MVKKVKKEEYPYKNGFIILEPNQDGVSYKAKHHVDILSGTVKTKSEAREFCEDFITFGAKPEQFRKASPNEIDEDAYNDDNAYTMFNKPFKDLTTQQRTQVLMAGEENARLNNLKIVSTSHVTDFQKGDAFKVNQKIWLEVSKNMETKGWTTKKPNIDNGYVEKGCILIYDHDYKDCMNFKAVNSKDSGSPEFYPSEIKKFCASGVMTQI